MKKRIFIASLLFPILLYTGISWGVLKMLVTPQQQPPAIYPKQLLPGVKSVPLRSPYDGIKLQGWWYPSSKDKEPPFKHAIIIVHGIHNHALNCHSVDIAQIYHEYGFNVMLFDQRGHGQSGGEMIGIGLRETHDMRAVVDFVLQQGIGQGQIGVHGVSFGAAVGLLATASIPEIGALIADSSYADIQAVIGGEISRQTGLPAHISSWIVPGVDALAKLAHGLDIKQAAPVSVIQRIAPRPVLLIHGDKDQRIPVSEAQRLKQAAGENTELWIRQGRGHNEGTMVGTHCDRPSPSRAESAEKISRFFKKALE